MGLYSEGFLSEGHLHLKSGGLVLERAHFRGSLVSESYGIPLSLEIGVPFSLWVSKCIQALWYTR